MLIASELWPAEADAPDATPSKLTWKGTSERVIAPCVAESRMAATVFGESGCLGVQPKVGGKLHLKPNNGTRPIANKYHEGKVNSTLERELKRPRNRWEGNACSRTGPRRVQGAARSRACRRHFTGRLCVRAPCVPGLSAVRASQVRWAPVDEHASGRYRNCSGRGELIADRAERPVPTEESGGVCTPVAQAACGRGALVRCSAASCHCLQCPVTVDVSDGRSSTSCALVAWLAVGCIRPVLKHGPRSAAVARVVRVSKPVGCTMKVKAGRVARRGESRLRGASSTDPLPRRGGIRVRALLLRPERW